MHWSEGDLEYFSLIGHPGQRKKNETTCWIKFCLLVIFGMLGVKNIVQTARTIKLCLVFKSHYSVIFHTSL